MSAIGTKRTSLVAPHMSAFGGKADIAVAPQCLLLTQSGHVPISASTSSDQQLGGQFLPAPHGEWETPN